MKDSFLDYKYGLAFLNKLNLLIEGNENLSSLFIYKNYNFLQAYEQSIFGDVLGWSESKNINSILPKTRGPILFKVIVMGLLAFLISIFSSAWLWISRRTILVFSMEQINSLYKNDFRLDPLYEALEAGKTPYIEIIHTIPGRKMLANFAQRNRPVIYLEAVDVLSYIKVNKTKKDIEEILTSINYTGFSEEEMLLAKALIVKYGSSVVISKYRIIFFKIVLSLSNVNKIFAIDDVRSINELIVSANDKNIDFYSIQHGHFTKYHVGWLKMTTLNAKVIVPKKILVWSKYWKNELLKLGTYFNEEEILIAGWPKKTKTESTTPDDLITILIPYEKNGPKKEITKYINEFLKQDDIKILFKLRPDQDKNEQLQEYNLLNKQKVSLVRNIDDVIHSIDVVCGTYSTFLYDMVLKEKPVGILDTSIDYGYGMIENALAVLITQNDICNQIKILAATKKEIITSRREKLIGESSVNLKETLKELITTS